TPEKKAAFDKALKLFQTHKLNLFTGENKDKVIADISALVKEVKPETSADDITAGEKKIAAVWDLLNTKRHNGELDNNDVLVMAMTFLSSMPEVKELLGSGLDLELIKTFLGGGDVSL